MKWILYLLMLIPCLSYGQSRTYIGTNNELNTRIGGYQVTGNFRPPMIYSNWSNRDSAGLVWFDSVLTKQLSYHNGFVRLQIVDFHYFDSAITTIVSGAGLTDTASAIRILIDSLYAITDSTLTEQQGEIGQLYDSSLFWSDTLTAIATKAELNNAIPDLSGYVPYTGATNDVDLGNNGIEAHDAVISFPSASGVALTVSKGGAGEALTVVKNSGSGNAMSVTGGVTQLSELQLTTDLADAYIASATTWNAKVSSVSGTGGRISSTGGTTPIIDLVTVNATPATYGGSNAIPMVTVDAYGRAATITTVSPSVTATNTVTLTNKRFTFRTNVATTYTTSVTFNSDNYDWQADTAQVGALLFNAPSGTPTHGQVLIIQIKGDGSALSWNAIFKPGVTPTTLALPAATTTAYLKMQFNYNSFNNTWELTGVMYN